VHVKKGFPRLICLKHPLLIVLGVLIFAEHSKSKYLWCRRFLAKSGHLFRISRAIFPTFRGTHDKKQAKVEMSSAATSAAKGSTGDRREREA
jgi:hypothetical protein